VLYKESIGENNSEYSVFTWDVGKVKARATGSRKILSRLAGHLEPGTLTTVRIIRKNAEGRFRVVEALQEYKTRLPAVIKTLSLTDDLTPLEEPDIKLFSLLKNLVLRGMDSGTNAALLKLLGFDPKTAKCGACGSEEIAYFHSEDIMFLCASCLSKRVNGRRSK